MGSLYPILVHELTCYLKTFVTMRATFAAAHHVVLACCLKPLVMMQGTTAAEWKECHAAALLIGKRGSEMADQMQHSACMLVMEYVPGSALFDVQKPFEAANLEQTAADLGRSDC